MLDLRETRYLLNGMTGILLSESPGYRAVRTPGMGFVTHRGHDPGAAQFWRESADSETPRPALAPAGVYA